MRARSYRHRIRPAALLLVLGLCATAAPSAPASAAAPPALEGIPRFGSVFVLILENQNFDTSWGPGSPAKYLNSLRAKGVFADHYFGTGHASLDNYIAMVSGQPDNPVTGSDCETVSLWLCVQVQSVMAGGRNLADQLEAVHVSWKGYMDGMPSPCFHQEYAPTVVQPDPYQGDSAAPPAKNYADRHNPFIYFDDIVGNDARCKAHVVPFTQLAKDLARKALPRFGFITPDTCHDGHDAPCAGGEPGGLTSADAWLGKYVPPLMKYLAKRNGLLLITFDENGFTGGPPVGCCTGGLGGTPGFGGRIGLIALSPRLPAGKVVTTGYDHMSLLRTLEDAFGITEHLNNAGSAKAMSDVLAPR